MQILTNIKNKYITFLVRPSTTFWTCSYDTNLMLTSVSVKRNSAWLYNGTCESLTAWVQNTKYLCHPLLFLS